MISSLLGAGLGHTVRSLAIREELRKHSNVKFNFVAPGSNFEYIKQNIKSDNNCAIYNFRQVEDLARRKENIENGQNILSAMKDTDLLLNDFYSLIDTTMDLFRKSLRVSLIHGSVIEYERDSSDVKKFKRFILNALKDYQIFFHINLKAPHSKPKIKCQYIPIPIIGRQAGLEAIKVKKILGLDPDEEFVLFHVGAGTDKTMYRYIDAFYKEINKLNIGYRIVVADNLAGKQFEFNSKIVKAPFFVNGMDLVSASKMVVTKPGMGIIQDCIVADKPILFVPSDDAERDLKIELLDEILDNKLPRIKWMKEEYIKGAIEECLSIEDLYREKYRKIPKNGADIMAKSLAILSVAGKENYKDALPIIKKFTPFI